MATVAIRKSTGLAETLKYSNRPQIWNEPGDAMWAIQQRYGSGAKDDFEFVSFEEWEHRERARMEEVTPPPPVATEEALNEGLVERDAEGANGGTA